MEPNVNGAEPQVSEEIGQADKTQVDIPTELTLECGATLSIRKPPPMLIPKIMESVNKGDQVPKVPTVWIEEKGREEENPNDPDYVAAMNVWNANAGMRVLNALIVSCLKIKDINDAYDPDGEDFKDFLFAVELEPAEGKAARFIQWFHTYAVVRDEFHQLTRWLMELAGVGEEDVAEAMKFLEGDTKLSANPVASA